MLCHHRLASTSIATLAVALVFSATQASAQAWQRSVIVNGQRMTPAQLAVLDAAQCTHIPNGRYWLNTQSGAWGYAGSPIQQGWLGDGCRSGQRHRSLSERGRLYSPHEILSGRP